MTPNDFFEMMFHDLRQAYGNECVDTMVEMGRVLKERTGLSDEEMMGNSGIGIIASSILNAIIVAYTQTGVVQEMAQEIVNAFMQGDIEPVEPVEMPDYVDKDPDLKEMGGN